MVIMTELYRITFSRPIPISLLRRTAEAAGFELLGEKRLGTTFTAEVSESTDVPSSVSEVFTIFDTELSSPPYRGGPVIDVARIRRRSKGTIPSRRWKGG